MALREPAKQSVIGVLVDEVTPESAVERVIQAAKEKALYRVSALAVHGVVEAHDDRSHLRRLNEFEMVTPDGQPVRWAMNFLHQSELRERVYGPTLMLNVCKRAEQEGLSIYLLGTDEKTLKDLRIGLLDRYPELRIAGSAPSTFGRVDREDFGRICGQIADTGADITFVGLGCPRQEIFTFESAEFLSMPVIAVGAAF
ncbi:MAG TPA: WecB/TagA/CpsF family glycosyltransferase, partial [Microthrixaceae bacterium]|nr:WecB/TagA/CpsF family glycosyltransferase [Microthrixaceae bacterium]